MELNQQPRIKKYTRKEQIINMTTKLEFFKITLNEFLKLKARNEKFNDISNEILLNDMTKEFPVNLSDSFCYPYESLVLKSLAQLWNEPEYVEDWINYLLYEAMDMKDGGKITCDNKEYVITNVDNLCAYLLDYYKTIGE